jgi:hypothetical protein
MTSLISKTQILKHDAKIRLQYKRKVSEKFENDTENARYAKRCKTKRSETKQNEAKILIIYFANRSENHVKRTAFRFHFA